MKDPILIILEMKNRIKENKRYAAFYTYDVLVSVDGERELHFYWFAAVGDGSHHRVVPGVFANESLHQLLLRVVDRSDFCETDKIDRAAKIM